MKVAVCLSGHFRKIDQHITSLNDFLINDSENQYDIFIHTWNLSDRLGENLTVDKIVSNYHPKKYVIEPTLNLNISDLMREKNIGKYDINGVLSMYYKIEQCNKLKIDYELENNFKYDCVIRFRGDVELFEPLSLSNLDLNKLYIPLHGDYYGINDQFAFSNSKNMDIYSSTFSNIEDHLKSNVFNPEIFTKETIVKNKLELVRPYIKYIIRRSNGDTFSNSLNSTWS